MHGTISESAETVVGAPHSAIGLAPAQAAEVKCLAHDARNWLTVLQVYCDLLRSSGAIAHGYRNWMDELSGAVERGHGLVDSLLDSVAAASQSPTAIAGPLRQRIQNGKQVQDEQRIQGGRRVQDGKKSPVAPSTDSQPSSQSDAALLNLSVDLSAALTRRLPLIRRLAGPAIQVEISAPPGTGNAALPETAFERILHNLVSNAIEAMPEGGHLRIALLPAGRREPADPGGASLRGTRPPCRAAKAGQSPSILLRVADTGAGIDPQHLPYIFEAGFSSKRRHASHPEQHGFGLAIVRELTQRAGGEIRVRSHPGQGSCFELELPRVGRFTARSGVRIASKSSKTSKLKHPGPRKAAGV